ncbi:hypothetical protein GY45DRAFT_382593 [Cubamyces sp. BRFM 1775]|nr:hypothetical protein GY45DRAFT_382593 [Cubamyces sp. BRFM 1775]
MSYYSPRSNVSSQRTPRMPYYYSPRYNRDYPNRRDGFLPTMGDTASLRSGTHSDSLSSLGLSISGFSPRAHSHTPTITYDASSNLPIFIDDYPPLLPPSLSSGPYCSVYRPIFGEPGQDMSKPILPPVVPGFERWSQQTESPSEAHARRHQHCWPQYCYLGDEKTCPHMCAEPAADTRPTAPPLSPPYRPTPLPGEKPLGHDAWPLAWWEIVPMPGRGTHLPNGWPRPTHVVHITHPAWPGSTFTHHLFSYNRHIEGLVASINLSGEGVLRSRGYTTPPVNPAGPCRASMVIPHTEDTRLQHRQY